MGFTGARRILTTVAVSALALGVALAGTAQGKSGDAFATKSKIDRVWLRCAQTGPWEGLVRVDTGVRHADVRREKRFRDHHLVVRAKVKLRKANGSRLATVKAKGKLRTAIKGKAIEHRYHAYLGRRASKRVLRYSRGSRRCGRKPGQARPLTVEAKISQRLEQAAGASASATGAGSPRTQSAGDTSTRNVVSANPPLFRAPIETPSGGFGPKDLAIGRFTEQPILDVTVPNKDSQNVSVLLGTGTGTFEPALGSPLPALDETTMVAVGRFRSFAISDIVAVNYETISVLFGSGEGSFAPGPSSPGSGTDVAAGDLNGDGTDDLVLPGNDSVSVLLGTGNGSFVPAPESPFGVGSIPKSVAVGDLNGDQTEDLAVANLGSDNVSVLLGDGTGGFVPATGSPFGVGAPPNFTYADPQSVAVGDVNGDGAKDLALANDSDSVSVLLGTGGGTFEQAPGSPFAAGNTPWSVAVGDMNGDGKDDVAVANIGQAATGNNVSVLLGTGTGRLSPAPGSPFATGDGNPNSVVVGDLNGDRKDDLAVANNTLSKGTVSVLLNNG